MIKPQLKEFMRRIDKDSVAIIPAAREAVRSHDTNYRYRQNSDFFYLTGFEEPDAIAVIAPFREIKVHSVRAAAQIWNRKSGRVIAPAWKAPWLITAPMKLSRLTEFDEKLIGNSRRPGRCSITPSGTRPGDGSKDHSASSALMRETNRKPLEPPLARLSILLRSCMKCAC